MRKTGKWIKQSLGEIPYEAFVPNLLPPDPPLKIDDATLNQLSTADRFFGRLDGMCELLPDVDFFIFMYIRKEAASSAQIEGTTATLGDLLKVEAEIEDPTIPSDVHEIVNYIEAMNYGINRLKDLPLCLRLIKEIHAILLKNVRGRDKMPGEFRKSQNWIGASNIKNATYVPPPPNEFMPLLDNFEKFLHDDTVAIPLLIKTALIHSQFELIHPFLDGNGRTGRLLTTFYLFQKGALRKPLLYLSAYFRKNRDVYYEKLANISKKGDLNGWLNFYLEAVIEISKEAVELSRRIIKLREDDRKKVSQMGRSTKNGLLLLERLYSEPIATTKKVQQITDLAKPNAIALINKFIKLGILHELSPEKKRNRVYVYSDYTTLFADNS